MQVRCPQCHSPIDLSSDGELSDIACPSCGSSFSLLGSAETAPSGHGAAKKIGHFELVQTIGVGTFGTVWRARDTELDRTVAIKIPRKGQLDPAETEQFLREARAAAQLRHPGIVSVHEVGREDGTVFIVSDFVEGITLADRLTARPFAAREAAELCAQIADALQHAHEQGVIHRDLKTANIMLDTLGAPHILDFGLARREAGEVTMTLDGRVLGTPAYLSPEQARGSSHTADARSDVYSLGVVLFELLTGELPFRGNTRMLIHQVIHEDPPSPRRFNSSVPRDLETICLKCLEKDAEKRYGTARALTDDLRRFLTGVPIQARAVGRIERTWRWCKRKPLVASLTAAVCGLLVAGTLISSYFALRAAQKVREVSEQKALVDRQAERSRRLRYASDMNVAQNAWEQYDIRRVDELLRAHGGIDGQPDLRSFEWYYLWRLLAQSKYDSYFDLPDTAMYLSLSPDARMLAVGQAYGGYVTLWDFLKRKQPNQKPLMQIGERTLSEWHENPVTFSPDGKMLACILGKSRHVTLHMLSTGESSELDVGVDSAIRALAFTPDSKRLAVGCGEGIVRIQSLLAPESFVECRGHEGPIRRIVFSAAGDKLASAGVDKTVQVFDAVTGEQRYRFVGHESRVEDVAFSPDGRLIASASSDATVRIWDLDTECARLVLRGCRDEARSVTFSPDGGHVAAGCRDGTVRVWNVITGTSEAVIPGYGGYCIQYLPENDAGENDDALVFCTWQDQIAVNKAKEVDNSLVVDIGASVSSVAFAEQNETTLMCASTYDPQRNVFRWKWESSDFVALPPICPNCDVGVIAVSFGGVLAVVDAGGNSVYTFDLFSGRPTSTWQCNVSCKPIAAFLTRSGDRLAVGFENGRALVYEVASGRSLMSCRAHDCISAISLDPKGTRLVTGGRDRQLKLWDVASGVLVRPPLGYDNYPSALAYTSAGDKLAVGFSGGVIHILQGESGEQQQVLKGHRLGVFGVAFFRDSDFLASASGDRTLKIWDGRVEQQRIELQGKASIFTCIAMSADERSIAAGTRDGKIKIYQAASPNEVINAGW